MAKSTRLGKGLGALLGDSFNEPTATSTENVSEGDRVLHLDLHLLDPNPFQPRTDFNEEALDELTQSIAQHGILQPLLVTNGVAGRYTIVAGERRWRAARKAGLTSVPAILKEYDDRALMEAALIENLQRSDLNPVEEAEAISVLMDRYGLTQEMVSSRIGKSRSSVANALRLLSLPPSILQYVRAGTLSSGHARAILMAPSDQRQDLAERIMSKGLSVRQAEKLAQALKKPPNPVEEKQVDPDISSAQQRLQRMFGTKVLFSGDLQRGRISIEYYSREDLERIYDLLLSNEAMIQ